MTSSSCQQPFARTLLAMALVVAISASAAGAPLDSAEALMNEAEEAQRQGNAALMESKADAACVVYFEQRGRDADETLECERRRVFLWYVSGQGKRALVAGKALVEARAKALGPEHRHTLRAESDIGLFLREAGDMEASLALNRRVLEARLRTLGERDPHTLDSYANLAQILDDLGHAAEALPLNRKAYDLSREVLGASDSETLISGINLAINLRALGRVEEALAHIDTVYVAARETLGDDSIVTIAAMQSLTVYMDELGRVEDALPLKQALVERSRRVRGPAHLRTITLMSNLAWSYAALRRFPLALDTVRQALDVATPAYGPGHLEVLHLRGREGQILLDAGEPQAALERLVPLEREIAQRLGEYHPLRYDVALRRWTAQQAGHPDAKAVEELRRIVENQPGHSSELEARRVLANAQIALGDDGAAVQTLRRLRDAAEALRESRALPRNVQAAAQAGPARGYKTLARVEQRLGQTYNAFASAEMAKGRTLLDSLALRRADRAGVLSPDDTDRLAEYELRQTSLDVDIGRAMAAEERALLEARRYELAREAAAFRGALRERHPKYAQLSQVTPVELAARRTLPPESVYVSYLVADGRLLVWTLGRDGPLSSRDLGEAATILANADAWRRWLSGSTTGPLWRLADGSHRFSLTAPEATAIKVHDPSSLERALSGRLLAPLSGELARARTWVISPDDALAALPFEALRIQSRRVIERHEVRYVQTLAVHKLLAERHDAYSRLRDRRTLLAIGAPRYGVAPDRIAQGDDALRNAGNAGGRSLDAMQIDWPPLPGAAREVDALAALFARAEIWKGERASERRLRVANRDGSLAKFRYLHFATHGYLSPASPLLTAIVLDQVDLDRESDGYVTVGELPAYALASDLVVLSACETGLGPLVQGEGIIGLPYALFVAGNADALVSLWAVRDDTTAAFMQRFFARVARGEGHAAALAAVKRAFAAAPKTRAPVYWAGFVLYGTR